MPVKISTSPNAYITITVDYALVLRWIAILSTISAALVDFNHLILATEVEKLRRDICLLLPEDYNPDAVREDNGR